MLIARYFKTVKSQQQFKASGMCTSISFEGLQLACAHQLVLEGYN
jgi:hypothetical protein